MAYGSWLEDLVRKLEDRLPLTFRWFSGAKMPPVGPLEVVWFEDETNLIGKIIMRRSGRTYVFTSYNAEPGEPSDVTITLDAHAWRHGSGGDTLAHVDVGSDPIGPYTFTWTKAHTWTPSASTTPITVTLAASQTADALVIQTSTGTRIFTVNASNAVGINTATPDAHLTVQATGLDPLTLNPVAWWKANALTNGGTEPSVNGQLSSSWPGGSAWYDSSRNGHNGTGVSPGQMSYRTSVQNGLPAVRFTGSTAGYFTFSPLISLSTFTLYVVQRHIDALGTNSKVLGSTLTTFQYVAMPASYLDGTGGNVTEDFHVQYGAPGQDGISGAMFGVSPDNLSCHVWSIIKSAASSSGGSSLTHAFYKDGVSKGALVTQNWAPSTAYTAAWDTLSYPETSGTTVDLLEVLVFDGVHSDSTRQSVEAYLNSKYNLNGGGSGGSSLSYVQTWRDSQSVIKAQVDSGFKLGLNTAPSVRLHAVDTVEQLRIGYDAVTNYASFTVSSGGDLTIAPTGGDTFITGNLSVSLAFDAGAAKFAVSAAGDLTKINNLTYAWPTAHTTLGKLQDNGSGTLTWVADDADLTAIAALTGTGILVRTLADTWALRTITASDSRITVTNPGGVAGNIDLTIPGAALTRVNDTNVTLTLGGTPTTALLAATSLTLGWTGTLLATKGGTGLGAYVVGDVLYADTTTTLTRLTPIGAAGTLLRSTGTLPAWATAATAGLATGTGTTNTLTKWTNTSGGLGDSGISDDGATLTSTRAATWDTGVHTFSALDVHNAGVSLGTSGILASAEVDAGGQAAFDLQVTTTRATDPTLVLRNTADGKEYMKVSASGEFAFGHAASLTTPTGIVLGFIQATNVGAPTWQQGIQAVINHLEATKVPVVLIGMAGQATHQSAGTTVTPSTAGFAGMIGLKGIVQNLKDTTGWSTFEACAVLGSFGVSSSTGALDMTTNGTETIRGDWKRASSFRGGFWSNTLATAATNRPAIVSGITVDIPGVSTNTGDQWGVEVLASTNTRAVGNQATTPTVRSAAASLTFPNRITDATHQNKLAHVYLIPQDGTFTHPTTQDGGSQYWTDSGGLYFDSGATNLVGLYQHLGGGAGAWKKLACVSQNETIAGTWTFTPQITLTGGFLANANSTFGDAATDVLTMTGRLKLRDLGSDPRSNSIAGTRSEVAVWDDRLFSKIQADATDKLWLKSDGNLYTSTSDGTTSAVTIGAPDISGATGIGSKTIPANSLRDGREIRIEAWGYLSTSAVPGTWTVSIIIGGTTFLTTAAFSPTGTLGNKVWHLQATLVVRDSGAGNSPDTAMPLWGQGHFTFAETLATVKIAQMLNAGIAGNINGQVDNAVSINASIVDVGSTSTITVTNLSIDLHN